MKLYETEYKICNKNKFKICIVSDVHISNKLKNNVLDKIVKYMNEEKPDYILIPGDLMDKSDELKTEKLRTLNWLKELGKISKTFIVLGNHDFIKNKKYVKPVEFIEEINKINNVMLLDNELYEDENIYLYGLTLNISNYKLKSKKLLLEDLNNIPNKSKKVNILMMHSPINVDKEVISKIDYDYIICGHMHNGCVPPFLNKIWKSSRGFLTPNKSLFGKNSRNTLNKESDKLLVVGPVTTFDKISGIFQVFNFMFPLYVTKMSFNKNETFKIKLTKKDN